MSVDEHRANQDWVWMRASAQIRKNDAQRLKRVNDEIGGLL